MRCRKTFASKVIRKYCCHLCYSESNKGHVKSPETREKLRKSATGVVFSKERLKNMSLGRQKKLPVVLQEELKDWLLFGMSDSACINHFKLSTRVFNRYKKLLFPEGLAFQCKYLEKHITKENVQEILSLSRDNVRYKRIAKLTKTGDKTVRRILEYYEKIDPSVKLKSYDGHYERRETAPERIFREFLEEKKIRFKQEFVPDSSKRWSFDFLIEDTNILVEIHGDYYHCNPSVYGKPSTEYHKWVTRKDFAKRDWAKHNGYCPVTIWEFDLKNNKEKVLEKFMKTLEKNTEIQSASSMEEMFRAAGYEFSDMEIGVPVDVSNKNIEILSCENEKTTWKRVLKLVKKPNAPKIQVLAEGFKMYNLYCSPDHKMYVKEIATNKESYVEAGKLINNSHFYNVFTEIGWLPVSVRETGEVIEIADIEVEGTSCYYSNGILSHNTNYGDPTTTGGGMAIPYASSVRLKMTGGQQIKNKQDEVIGIEVAVKTIKNKVARPFRGCNFRIIFGKGIVEDEEVFDLLRTHCSTTKNGVPFEGVLLNVEGTGAWKTFTVTDASTGEVLKELKFYKSDFGLKVLNNPEFKDYIDALMDAALIVGQEDESHFSIKGIEDGENIGPQDMMEN